MPASDAQLLIIDTQNDFMGEADGLAYAITIGEHQLTATLPVADAISDMRRAADMLDRLRDRITDIHVTMCAHHRVYVGHPGFWQNSDGKSPDPFTQISRLEIMERHWFPRDLAALKPMIEYADALELLGYKIDIWPEHCVVGTWGQTMQIDIAQAIARWEDVHHKNADKILKGTSLYREHYGALMAEVHDRADPSTQLNIDLLDELKACNGPIAVLGEASSHCVKRTMEQITDFIDEEHWSKFHILVDCMSPVTGYSDSADEFLIEMVELGVNVIRSDEFLA